jgi:hypothetical protein
MTSPHLLRSTGLLARGALVAVVLAGCAGTAVSRDRATDPTPTRTAVLADVDAPATAIGAATGRAGDAAAVTVRRASGSLDAQAQAIRLAAEGYDTIVAVGAEARAAVAQAAGGEVGAPDTVWQTH